MFIIEGGLVMDVHNSDKHLDDPSRVVAIPKVAKVSDISVEKSIRIGLNKKQDLHSFFVFIDVDESGRQNLLSIAASSKEAAEEWKSIIEQAIERMAVIAPSEDVESQMVYVEEEDDGEDDGAGSDDGAESNNGSSRSIVRKSSLRGLSFNPIASASARSMNSGPSSPKVGSSSAMDVDYSDTQSQVSSQKKQHFTMIHRASSLFLHKGSPGAKAFEKEDPSMSRRRTYNPFIGKGNESNWNVVTVTDGVHIYGEKEFKKDFPQLRTSVEVPASAKEVVKLILDDSQRSKWDDSIESYEVVKSISTFAQLVYVKLKPFWVGALWTGARDLIMMRYWREDPMEDNPNEFTYTVVWQSVDDPAYYKSPEGYTRGKIFSMGFTVRPLTEKTSFLESSCHADPGGAMSWMPNSVIQKWIQPFMLRVLGIRKLLDEKSKLAVITGEEEKKQANKSSDAASDETPKKKRSSFARKRNSAATGTPLNVIKEVAPPVEEKTETDVSKTAESSNQDGTAASEGNEETTHADTPTAADAATEQAVNQEFESTSSQNVVETTTSNEVENETTTQQESNEVSVAATEEGTKEAQSTEDAVEESPKQSEEPPARPASIKVSQEETVKPAPVAEPPKKRPIYNRNMKGSFAAESWMTTPEDDPFPIRGKTYLTDSKKIPSEKHKFELIAVSVDSVETQTPHIAARSDSLTWALKEKYENRFQFIIQFMAGEFSVVLYLLAKPGVLDDGSAFAELFNDFIEGTNEYRDNRFKLIPRVVKGAWILKKAVGTTPAILGKKLTQQYFPGPHYFELDVNVNSR